MHNRQLCLLNLVHASISILLISLTLYLLNQSITQKLNDCNWGFYTNCQTIDEDLRVILNLKESDKFLQDGHIHSKNNIDWIGLNQYALTVSLLLITIFGVTSVFLGNRKSIFIAILLYLLNLVQIALIETSDDRDFPQNIFRDGYTVSQYSVLYLNNSSLSLLLKSLYLLLILTEFILLIVHFVVLRFELIFRETHYQVQHSSHIQIDDGPPPSAPTAIERWSAAT